MTNDQVYLIQFHSMKTRLPLTLLAAGCILHPSSFVRAQGILTPPGAPAPAMKTLDQLEPRTDLQATPAPSGVDTTNTAYHFIITQPGSYYLSANLSATKTNGIQINAAGVTLDLNGFQVSRASGSGGGGIEISSTSHRASVRNGSIKGFGIGVNSIISVSEPRGCAFRDLAVGECASSGIVTAASAVLESCRVHDNNGPGIIARGGSSLTNCVAANNAGNGIEAGDGSSLTNCVATGNTGATITGSYGIWHICLQRPWFDYKLYRRWECKRRLNFGRDQCGREQCGD